MYKRAATYAGSFYPASKSEISSMIDEYMHAATPMVSGEIVALVSPHAGYIYSGPVAAWAYAAVAGKSFDCVIVLAPSHRGHFEGMNVPPAGEYTTPLGTISLDEPICQALSKSSRAVFHSGIDAAEHSLEVQLPFLQKAVGTFTLVPVIIGTTDYAVCEQIASDIFNAIKDDKRRILIVISTDLSHYHPYNDACLMDGRFSNMLEKFDAQSLSELLSDGESEACGEGPLITGIILSQKAGAKKTEILHYANSGDTAGDKSRVVGYISAAFVR
jgi:MEMO1 family protein